MHNVKYKEHKQKAGGHNSTYIYALQILLLAWSCCHIETCMHWFYRSVMTQLQQHVDAQAEKSEGSSTVPDIQA